MVQLSHPYMTTGKTRALTRWTFVGKVMSLLFNMLCRLVITFLPSVRELKSKYQQSGFLLEALVDDLFPTFSSSALVWPHSILRASEVLMSRCTLTLVFYFPLLHLRTLVVTWCPTQRSQDNVDLKTQLICLPSAFDLIPPATLIPLCHII